jgi:hypothetical protein
MLAGAKSSRPLLTQISWWAKFGQPLEEPADMPPAAGEPAVLHDNGYGHDYAYGPGSCDCSPPCTDHLWTGYVQMPWRCTHPQYKYRGWGHGCGLGACGHCSDSCQACSAPASCGCTDSAGSHALPAAVPPPAAAPPVPAADEASVLKRQPYRSVSTGKSSPARQALAKPGIR